MELLEHWQTTALIWRLRSWLIAASEKMFLTIPPLYLGANFSSPFASPTWFEFLGIPVRNMDGLLSFFYLTGYRHLFKAIFPIPVDRPFRYHPYFANYNVICCNGSEGIFLFSQRCAVLVPWYVSVPPIQ